MIQISIINNKKGQGKIIGPSGSLITATIVIAILLVVFFLLFKGVTLTKKSNEIPELSARLQITDSLIAYLKTPAEISGQTIRMSDLIMLAAADISYKSILETKTKEIFEKYGKTYQIWIKQDSRTIIEMNPYAPIKYGLNRADIELPGKIIVYLQLEKEKT